MSKDEFLLKALSSWWGCVRKSELFNFLRCSSFPIGDGNGAWGPNSGTTTEDVQDHYPEWDDDKDGDVGEKQSKIVQAVMDDVNDLLDRLKEKYEQEGV